MSEPKSPPPSSAGLAGPVPEPVAAAALATFETRHPGLLDQIEAEGRARHGDLGLGRQQLLAGLLRIARACRDSATAGGDPPPPESEVLASLIRPDVYLAEALLAGTARAWTVFETILEHAFLSVRTHHAGIRSRIVLGEIRETILGTFFLDGKIATYRATAPIGAWARQVIFNIFRQNMNRHRDGRETTALSQLAEDARDLDTLLPPSRERPPVEILADKEWSELFAKAVPAALKALDRDEQRMLKVLPSKSMTQVELGKELGVSPFKLNRWYKEVRHRFLRELTHQVRLLTELDEVAADRLVAYLVALWD